jgi:hypothetical protein
VHCFALFSYSKVRVPVGLFPACIGAPCPPPTARTVTRAIARTVTQQPMPLVIA